jgi:hypothetical protein
MPAQPTWHVRVQEILATLNVPESPPFLDRSAFERLFQVRRRQAIRLLVQCDGYQVGKTFLAGRESVIAFLESVNESGAPELSRGRRLRVGAAIDEAANRIAASRTRVSAPSDLGPALHLGIQIPSPGKLQISYSDAGDLLTRIVELATFAANDFTRFQKVFEGRE